MGKELLSVPEGPGFYVTRTEEMEPDPTGKPRVMTQIVFIPYGREEDCPCGSGQAFGSCCLPLGVSRIFAASPGGGYAPAIVHTEEWNHLTFDTVREKLAGRPEFACMEDSPQRCFWRYRGQQGTGREFFGTVELLPGRLIAQTLSRPRHAHIRAALEETLGPLPRGRLQVEVLRHVEGPAPAGLSLPAAESPEGDGVPVLEAYRSARARLNQIYRLALKEVLPDEFAEAAKRLGLLAPGGVLATRSGNEESLVMDTALYEVRRHGRPVIVHFCARNAPADPEAAALHRAIGESRVGLFHIEQVTTQYLVIRDALSLGRETYRLADFGLVSTGEPGMGIVTRLLRLDRFAMTSGWGFGIPPQDYDRLLDRVRAVWTATADRNRTIALIRYCLENLASFHVTIPPVREPV
ncbi:SEC-C domain-containing protein [Caldinitratiruptor microaerophilus]|uniref:SEC-C motif-containing protein n=1 Tax=Caldinitratiruptor microaerophilus TaxID=671077 RepID=A0AA35CN14_9FIRM|nr:SEC-C domain-containing protein [Caldinitratiruptor microaerophilus]BDG62137.1 hypothetical protein caldi_32270 [Caldinitratiruptor microaerophilus]